LHILQRMCNKFLKMCNYFSLNSVVKPASFHLQWLLRYDVLTKLMCNLLAHPVLWRHVWGLVVPLVVTSIWIYVQLCRWNKSDMSQVLNRRRHTCVTRYTLIRRHFITLERPPKLTILSAVVVRLRHFSKSTVWGHVLEGSTFIFWGTRIHFQHNVG